MKRPDWDTYFMQMTELVATRSTCLRRKVGAVIVKDNQVLATGYNSPPRGAELCHPIKYNGILPICLRELNKIPSGERHELCRALHAEQNAIVQASRHGVCIKDSVLYCNFKPCIICIKMIINAGIKEVIYKSSYDDKLVDEIVIGTNTKLRQFEEK